MPLFNGSDISKFLKMMNINRQNIYSILETKTVYLSKSRSKKYEFLKTLQGKNSCGDGIKKMFRKNGSVCLWYSDGFLAFMWLYADFYL